MEILVNGESRALPEGLTVAGLLDQSGFGGRRVAVELNGEILPKSLHAQRVLSRGDRVEILQAIGGG